MRKILSRTALALAGTFMAGTAMAQTTDVPPPPPESTETPDDVAAPDGSDAFGFEPYFGVMGGYASYDRNTLPESGIPETIDGRRREGWLVEGVVGANIPLGAFFVGAEGNVAKGVDGIIDWQYGVAGRVGLRAGETGMIYGKAGYEWVNFTDAATGGRDYGDEIYGLGFEVGPREIGLGGLTGESGARIRFEITSRDFETLRPMAGFMFHF
ncbi:MAG: opacity protein [Sphingorhabdus sp.]